MVVVRARRRVSACALPRPSAMASAKLANSTVNHNQAVTASTKIVPAVSWLRVNIALGAVNSRRTNSMVVITLPTSTTNITGFLSCTRGSSFLNESGIARRMILGSQIEIAPLRRVLHCLTSKESLIISESPPRVHQQILNNRSQRIRREVGERSHDQDYADQEAHEQRSRRGEGAQSRRHDPLLDQGAAKGHDGDQEGETPDQHRQAPRPVVVWRVAS